MRRGSIVVLGSCLLFLAAGGQVGAEETSDERLPPEYKISTAGPELQQFFRQRAVGTDHAARIKTLIQQLGDDDFEKREQASRALVLFGVKTEGPLQKATKDTDLEVSRRATDCLKQIEQGAASMAVSAAARVLARKKPAGAVAALLGYLPSAEDETVAQAVRDGLGQLAVRDGKADPALVAALEDQSPARRIGAGVALARANLAEQKEVVRKLLKDTDAQVRFRVGLALASRERDALPVLIELLAEPKLSPQEMGVIEDFLYRLADDKQTPAAPANEPAARRKYRDDWQAWWKEHGKGIDLTRINEAARLQGNTLVVLLDQGQVIDLDNQNKPRFTLTGLDFPLDVQYLPGDRVLVAEHNGSRVSERNRENKVLWEKRVDQPLAAQRLPNGNTFIATRSMLLEVDKDGKEVFTHTFPGGELVMRAAKLRNGDIAVITQLGVTRFARLDRTGKEISGFGVDIRTSGGKIDVLPNGNVLIPENANNRVVEHDPKGKVVSEKAIESPIVATRLPNGNTLVTSMSPQKGAVELDPAGKEVWSYKADTRVTRAYRR